MGIDVYAWCHGPGLWQFRRSSLLPGSLFLSVSRCSGAVCWRRLPQTRQSLFDRSATSAPESFPWIHGRQHAKQGVTDSHDLTFDMRLSRQRQAIRTSTLSVLSWNYKSTGITQVVFVCSDCSGHAAYFSTREIQAENSKETPQSGSKSLQHSPGNLGCALLDRHSVWPCVCSLRSFNGACCMHRRSRGSRVGCCPWKCVLA